MHSPSVEDELPSRIDFGKTKYGGPFTTEQVQDVKVLLGILCVLLALGPSFAIETAATALLPTFAQHLRNTSTDDCFSKLIINNGTLTSITIAISIPLYLLIIRPYVQDYMPGMLKRMGIGMVFFCISLLVTFFTDTAGHVINENATCFLSDSPSSANDYDYLHINTHFLILQSYLNSLGYMLFYSAAYQFICAQSPHSMKGLLIGAFFAINGLFHLLSVLGIFLPFTFWRHQFPSCSFGYYLTNIVLYLVGIVIFVCIAKWYKLRERDEPSNRYYMYAEEYYAKAQDEPNYDYDDYDNLKVQTIG